MATEILQEPEVSTYEAITEFCTDAAWNELDGNLPIGVWRRLAVVDRSLYASTHIAEMLVKDARGKRDARDDERVTFEGLSSSAVEALELAMIELNSRANEHLEEVRTNAHGCAGKRVNGAQA
jgi:hypothetical protein